MERKELKAKMFSQKLSFGDPVYVAKEADSVMDSYEARIKELEKEVDSVKMNSGYVAFMEAQARIKELEERLKEDK